MRAAALILLLAGCAANPVPQVVHVEVARPCLTPEDLPAPAVTTPDAELAKLPDFDLVIALATDRLEYRRYSNEAQAALIACTQ